MTIPVFPQVPGLTFPLTRTPIWKTNVQEPISGKSTFVPLWTFPKYRWELPFSLLRNNVTYNSQYDEFSTLLGFYNSIYGRGAPFHYSEADDKSVAAASPQNIGTGDGSTATFLFTRSIGGFGELVQDAINDANLVVSVAGVQKTLGTDFNLHSTSLYGTYDGVTFISGHIPTAGQAITWSGNYYWLCEMDKDECPFEKFDNYRYQIKQFSFTSLKQ